MFIREKLTYHTQMHGIVYGAKKKNKNTSVVDLVTSAESIPASSPVKQDSGKKRKRRRSKSESNSDKKDFQKGPRSQPTSLGPVAEEGSATDEILTNVMETLSPMADIPKKVFNKETREMEIQRLNKQAKNQKFKQRMANTRLESLQTAAVMSQDQTEMERLKRNIANLAKMMD